MRKNINKKPEYYKYLEFLSQHSSHNILDIHIMVKDFKIYPLEDLKKLINFYKQFGFQIDIVDFIVLENE